MLQSNQPKKNLLLELSMFLFLVFAGVGVRLLCQDIPNFAPVAGIALFAGYFFTSRWTAAATPLAIMIVSDIFVGGYDSRVMMVVYATLVMPIVLRTILRSRFSLDRPGVWDVSKSLSALTVASVATSVVFFLTTNFAVWACYGDYESSWSGLMQCYVRALPFFRFTLASDAFFSLVFFTGYAVATRFGWSLQDRRSADQLPASV